MALTFVKAFPLPITLMVLLTCASQVKCRTLEESSIAEKYNQWMTQYGRTYPDEAEKERRANIFKKNLEHIEKANKEANRTYKLSTNEFSDLTTEEFVAKYTGFKKSNHSQPSIPSFQYKNLDELPTSMDWREKGAVTPVKNQGGCACCWAFSAVAALEALIHIQLGLLIPLSEQQLLDCTTVSGKNNCNGGSMADAFAYIIQNQGLTTEKNYPYEEKKLPCLAKQGTDTFSKISKYDFVLAHNEKALLNVVSKQPVSIPIDGGGEDFKHYKSGVFNGPCGTDLNHAVTIVGYGTTEDGINYWLIKNSWGPGWGEGGYMRIKRDVGLCGLDVQPVFPII